MSDLDSAFSSPQATREPRRFRCWRRLLALGVFGYPVLLLSSLYHTWVVAWFVLGHLPRPNLDDPKYISLFVDIPYGVTMLLMMGAPGAFLLGVFLSPIALDRPAASSRRRALRWLAALGVLVLLWAAAIWFLRADPWEVGTWYFD